MEIKKAGTYTGYESTANQPFPAGTCGCNQFRIPGIITLQNGNLFATADARWDDADHDYGGIDTVFSISEDSGKTWHPGFAAMFPDTDGTPVNPHDATTCIDPCAVQDTNGKIHIFVNMNPSGITTGLGWPKKGNGFVSVKGRMRLALTDSFQAADNRFRETDNNFLFIGDFRNGYAPILRADGTSTDYSVDGFFNIYENDKPVFQEQVDTEKEIQQNIFYRDSLFHVFNTMLTLHLTFTAEGRITDVKIISDEIKLPEEDALISSPGNGAVTPSGTLLMPFYTYNDKDYRGYPLIVFSEDSGKSWKRSSILPATDEFIYTGESKIVPIKENVWRVFLRNQANAICYADYLKDEDRWLKPVKTEIKIHSDCNLSAIIHDGIIYVSAPAGEGPEQSGRVNGKLFAFSIDNSSNLVFEYEKVITDKAFSYSCMTVIDNNILCLYDTCGDGQVILKTIPIKPE